MCIFFHEYEVIRVEYFTWELRSKETGTINTTLYKKCKKCGEVTTQDMDGKWMLEDFK